MSLMAATAVGLRLLERVEAIVDRERPELPTVQRKAIAAQLAYEWVNAIGDTLEHLVARVREWRIERETDGTPQARPPEATTGP
jgi:hypothetical protein